MKYLFPLIMGLLVSPGCSQPPEESCVFLTNDAGDLLYCVRTGDPVYICGLEDDSACWYETGDIAFYNDADSCDDPRGWESPAEDLVTHCTP